MIVSVYDIILKAFFFNLMCKVVDYKDTSRILIDSIGTILGCQKPGKKCMWYQFSNSLLWDLQIKHYKIPRHPHRRNKTTMPVLPDFRNDPHSHCKILHISNRIHTKESFTEKLTLNSFKYQGPDKHLNEVAITSFQTNGRFKPTGNYLVRHWQWTPDQYKEIGKFSVPPCRICLSWWDSGKQEREA